MMILSSAIQKGKAAVFCLSEQTEDLYSKLIAMSPDSARRFLSPQDRSQFEACETFLRSLDITVKNIAEEDQLINHISDEIKQYREIIVRAHLLAGKLNSYAKQLDKMSVTPDDKISNYDGLNEPANYTTGKVEKEIFH